ncbi:TonB C-terminal domain-containing protein [Variovorax sp. 54]|uniref:TonB C-terminal domain-containing protein n=1 Tax=Variovorax sp. 54 TaxID=2035212 RepID=UPI0015D49DDA|nr:TonB C-terminal domain-containing protein [Variovorax sp. 54]
MRAFVSGLTCTAVCVCIAWISTAKAAAAGTDVQSADPATRASPESQMLDFDVPAQPLAAALAQYAAVSGRSVMFIDEWVAGRTSAPVRGRYTPHAALRALLAGAGFTADDVDTQLSGAFILKRVAAAPGVASAGGSQRGYDALVQARVWDALCADLRTAPGHYRAILQLQVAASGRIGQASLVSSSGDPGRDAAMLAALAPLKMDRPPPADLALPLTLAILPHDVLPGPRCATVH